MKSQFADRDTVGTMIVNTHEKHINSDPIEAGEITNEFGKKYMSDLIDYVEEGTKTFDKFYINILSRKTKLYMRRAIEVFPYIMPKLPMMQTNQDVWFVDANEQKLELLWSLPDESEFDMVLNDPTNGNEQGKFWIKEYLKLKKGNKIWMK